MSEERNDSRFDKFIELVNTFPENPGVYIMKDISGTPIYIGKAINLKHRVKSYFMDTHEDRAHIPVMLTYLHSIEWIATRNETEALILEANLIRKNKPRFNIDLRDDKHFPYLKVTVKEPFPRLLVVRRVVKDGSRYFGPYTDARSMRKMAAYAQRIFRLRDCNKNLPLSKPIRPCINYSMGHCSGACAGKIDQESYYKNVEDLCKFLSGKRKDLLHEFSERMETAAEELRFEDAARIRDQIQLVKDASKLQQVDLKLTDIDCDVFGLAENGRFICLSVLHFREGLLLGTNNYLIKRTTWDLATANLDSMILQFYLDKPDEIPSEIIIPDSEGFHNELLQVSLNQQLSISCQILKPQKGTKRLLIDIANKNAKLYMDQKNPPNAIEDLEDLQKVLELPRLPQTIEAFDISNLGESFTVAAMVQYVDGVPNKGGYRRFKIRQVEGQNDFAMMMEAVSRRLARLRDENKQFPDLLLIDGGKGQLNAAIEAIKMFENPPYIASLAKREEILFSPLVDGPIQLPVTHPARKLVERIRDDVHRFAITYHRKIRGKQFGRSQLENIPGIGKKRAEMLLKQFGSVKGLREASPEKIAEMPGFSIESASKLKEILLQLETYRQGG